MTYCLALCLPDGLVFGADTRTNAGVDYVTNYSKLHVFQPAADRLIVILSAGNLGTTQEVLNRLQVDLDNPQAMESLRTVTHTFDAAAYVGRVSRAVQANHADALGRSGIDGSASFIVGVQIQGHGQELYLVYPQGNYISASPETPYLQIGESKYGKPILDRAMGRALSLADGSRLALVSLDATRRSNATVGAPFEIAVCARDSFAVSQRMSFSLEDPYFQALTHSWQEALGEAFGRLPRFAWE